MKFKVSDPLDVEARRKAIQPFHSFIVSAPAGSGKTGLLTLRVLKLLSVVKKPEEILCITFTRKAAQEMHERIFDALRKALELRSSNRLLDDLEPYEREMTEAALAALDHDHKYQWQLLQAPTRLNISTIDGFCKSLCNQLPFSSGLGTNAGIIDIPNAEYRTAVTNWLDDAQKASKGGTNDDANQEAITTLIAHLGGNLEKLVELFMQLLSVRDQWLPLLFHSSRENRTDLGAQIRGQFESILQTWVEDAIHEVEIYFRPYESELYELLRYAKDNSENTPPHIEALLSHEEFVVLGYEAASYWRAMAELFLTQSSTPSFRKKLDKRNGFPPGTNKEDKATAKQNKAKMMSIILALSESTLDIQSLAALKKLPDPEYNNSQWVVLDALFTILPKLVAYLRLRFIEAGGTDFLEFSLASVAALNAEIGDVDLLQRLDYTIQHILIDEFQDTSQIQLSLLQSLTTEWQPNDGRSLFLVGDAMQSCYSFRNANVGIFLNMRAHGLENIDIEPIDLEVNFRSSAAIVNWVNHHFSCAFPIHNEPSLGAVKYNPSCAFNTADDMQSYVRCVAIDTTPNQSGDKPSVAESAKTESEFICEEIQSLKNENPEQSIAVLVKSRSHVKTLIEAFTLREIDYQAVDIDPIISKQHIIDIQSLTKILTQPLDKIAWLACLRSPFCGLSHADLYHVFCQPKAQRNSDSPIALLQRALSHGQLSIDAHQRVDRFLSLYKKLSAFIGRRCLAEHVELFWYELGGPEQLSNESELIDIQRFLGLLEKYEVHGQLDWQSINQAIQLLFAAPASSSNHPVQIMTMHKSKGLEFDSVFIPQLHKTPRVDDPELLYWLERANNGQTDFILSPIAPAFSDQPDSLTEFIKSQKKLKAQIEESRVFYVACTRAKSRLYLSAALEQNDASDAETKQMSESTYKAPSKQSLLAKIWSTAENEFRVYRSKPDASASNRKKSTSTLTIKSMPLKWQSEISPYKYDARLDDAETEHELTKNEGLNIYQEFSEDRKAATVGTVFHTLLQHLVDAPDSHIFSNENSTIQWLNCTLRQHGLSRDAQHYWAEKIVHSLASLSADRQAAWILDPRHIQSACELELTEQRGEHVRQHIIDRTFIDDGVRWIIDYKTTRPSEGQHLLEFERDQEQQYHAQLKRYRGLMHKYDERLHPQERPRLIRVALYFPFIQHFLVVESLDLNC